MLGTCMYRCVILYCIHILCAGKAQFTHSWIYRQNIFSHLSNYSPERVCRNLDLVFSVADHKYSIFVAGAIWSSFAAIWTQVSRPTLKNILLILQRRFGARLPESGPRFHSRRLQKFFFYCRGDWSAFAGIWTWDSQRTRSNILLLLEEWSGARLSRSWPRFLGRRSQIFYFCCRGDLERVCRNLDLGFTADALIPNEHRGRLNLLEFQRYFARLPDSIIFNETSTSSYESLKKKGKRP